MSYSRKFLNYMISEEPSSEKKPQLGCITGIVQLFDRNHIQNLCGNRRTTTTSGRSLGSEPVENVDIPRCPVDSTKQPKRWPAFRRLRTEAEKESKRSEGESPYRLSPGLRNVNPPDAELPYRVSPGLRDVKPPEAELPYRVSPGLRNVKPPEAELPDRVSPGLRNKSSEAEFPYRLSPGLRNKSRRRTQSTESFQIPWQCEDESMESPPNLTAKSRFSCDSREIPSPPPVVDHRDSYRSISLRTMEFPRISVGVEDSPATGPRSILAELMGLKEMLNPPLKGRKAKDPAPRKPSSPRSPRALAAKIMMDQPLHKSESAIQAQDLNNSPARLDRPAKDSNLSTTVKIPAEQGVQDSSDVKKALDEAEEALKIYACSDPKLPAIKAKVLKKLGSLSPIRDESRAFSSSSSGKSQQKMKKFDDDLLSKRSKRIANKMLHEISNAASPHKNSSRFRSEILPPRPLKDNPNEKRVKKAVEIRLDKTRFKRDEESSPPGRCNSDFKFGIQSSKARRSLDFSPKSRQVNSNSTNQECKAEQKSAAAKICEREFIPYWQPEQQNVMHSTGHNLQKTSARSFKKVFIHNWLQEEANLMHPTENIFQEEPNLMHSTENILQENSARSFKEEFITDWQPAEQNLMYCSEYILQETTAKPWEKECISQEPDLFDSTENILQNPEPRDSFHCNHGSQSNGFNVRDYVTDLFTASGLLKDGEEEKDISLDLYFPGNFSIEPQIFHELEKKYRNDEEADAEHSKRRVLFDTVNEVLRSKCGVPPYSRIPQRGRGRCSSRRLMMSGNDVVNSVVMEIESLTSVHWGNTLNGVNKLGEDDLEISNTEAMDLSEVALAVEQGIFRDLMDEFLHDLSYHPPLDHV